jgi:pimeloyl-ACP methyl ester carboxylesterase
MSRDGTRLAVRRSGLGPPVVLVHGSSGGIDSFALLEHLLAERRSVLVYDRRGRGGSADHGPYAFEREVEDVLAVLSLAGAPADLVGHSFGGACALAAAASGAEVRTLTLYEPALCTSRVSEGAWRRAFEAIEAGDLDLGLDRFFEIAGIIPAEAAAMRALPRVWDALRAGVRTVPREVAALTEQRWPASRLAAVHVPTLLLSGSETLSVAYPAAGDLAGIDRLQAAVLRGQRHLAFGFDPAGFAASLTAFLDRSP